MKNPRFITTWTGRNARSSAVGYRISPWVTTAMNGNPPMIIGFHSGSVPIERQSEASHA